MSDPCLEWRRDLESCLRGRPRPGRPGELSELGKLSLGGHILACPACRDLLEQEQALETLLDSLPEPKLPADLTERLLLRLRASEASRAAAADPLDRLLDAGLLDAVLDQLPEPRIPAGLGARTLAALEARRRPARPTVRPFLSAAAAAALLLALAVALGPRGDQRPESQVAVAERSDAGPAPAEPAGSAPEAPPGDDEELLVYLDVLENWELLLDGELDALLSSADPLDELLLDVEVEGLDGGEGVRPEGAREEPSRG